MSAMALTALVVTILVFFILLSIRLHVALSLMIAGFVGVIMLRSTSAAVSTVANSPFSTSSDYSLAIIPLFIAMGVFAVNAGLAQAGFDLATRLLRRFPGGTALASIAGSGMFAAVTGSSVATVATMARVSTEAIRNAGHTLKLAAGVVCAGGTLGVLIPPSIVLVLYGVVTEESIGQLLLAGIGPGLLTILMYGLTVVFLVARERRKRAASGEQLEKGDADKLSEINETSTRTSIRVDYVAVLYLIIIFLVSIGTIYAGIATPTEAASFGSLSALIILLIRTRPPRWLRVIKDSMGEAVGMTAMTFFLMAGAGIFTYFLALSGASTALVNAVVSAELPPYVVLALCLLILLPLGMFLDGLSMILVAAPLLHPILTAYGFDGIWLGIVIVKVAELALITPPVGMNAFVYSGTVPEAKLWQVFKGIFPFVIADLVVVAILIAAPQIVTFIPGLSNA